MDRDAFTSTASLPDIVGKIALVVALQEDNPTVARAYIGLASLRGDELSLLAGPRVLRFPLGRQTAEIKPFPVAVLSRLIEPKTMTELTLRLNGVDACLALFTSSLPEGGTPLDGALNGVATGASGQVLLMQV